MVRPAWAHSYGCKSRRKLATASEAKRNCMRATECGEEARGINHEPMYKNRIQGEVSQGEQAINCEALVVKDWQRKCGGCVMKECALTWGGLALCLKGRHSSMLQGVSSDHSRAWRSKESRKRRVKREGAVTSREDGSS
jgi:hypothetical protein